MAPYCKLRETEEQVGAPPSSAETRETAAHDFGNLLQCAVSALRLCERQLRLRGEAELAAMTADAQEALDRATVLALRLAGAERRPRTVRPLRVAQVIGSMLGLLRHALGEKVVLETAIAEHLPAVRCDRGDLENVLLNLAINAREAMPGRGRLLIEASADRIAGSLAGTMTISVSDTGCGMPAEVAARAFERSFSTKAGGGPRGLGLAAVRQFARDVGGSATLESEVGRGTSIRLRLPAADLTGAQAPAEL
jgi:signal transduction histidine kinase